MTVPYLCSANVPLHWAQLVEASSHLEVYTERQVGTWQSLLDLEVDWGDFLTDFSQVSTPTVNQDREGEVHSEAVSTNVESPHDATRVNHRVTFSDEWDDEI
jgi:hypothetical protein